MVRCEQGVAFEGRRGERKQRGGKSDAGNGGLIARLRSVALVREAVCGEPSKFPGQTRH